MNPYNTLPHHVANVYRARYVAPKASRSERDANRALAAQTRK